jgi:hypothetical protein
MINISAWLPIGASSPRNKGPKVSTAVLGKGTQGIVVVDGVGAALGACFDAASPAVVQRGGDVRLAGP